MEILNEKLEVTTGNLIDIVRGWLGRRRDDYTHQMVVDPEISKQVHILILSRTDERVVVGEVYIQPLTSQATRVHMACSSEGEAAMQELAQYILSEVQGSRRNGAGKREGPDGTAGEQRGVAEPQAPFDDEHPNIGLLVERMDDALKRGDPAQVLHASASIFETLAKDVINLESIQDKSLGSFFARYRNDSGLPDPILDYILEIYNRRSTEPLAGHGSTRPPNIAQEEAIILAEMTKAFVRIERQLAISRGGSNG